jgi:hypothetical protein
VDEGPLSKHLAPLEAAAVERIKAWLPKLSHPVRTGEHSQTAFALGLMLDWARHAKDTEFETLLKQRARDFYFNDRACPINYEPGGQDFVSPCLAEADVMPPCASRARVRRMVQPLSAQDRLAAGSGDRSH